MRSTLHVVSAADYLSPLAGDRPDARAASGARTASSRRVPSAWPRCARVPRPSRPSPEASASCAITSGRADGMAPDEVLWWIRRRVAVRPRAVGRAVVVRSAAAPGARARPGSAPTAGRRRPTSIEHLVRRYLGAFGPATAADLAAVVGPGGRRACGRGSRRIEAAGDLRRFSDERGRELLDLDGAPLPERGHAGAASAAADVGLDAPGLRRPDPADQRRGPARGHRPERRHAADLHRRWPASPACGGRRPRRAAGRASSSSRSGRRSAAPTCGRSRRKASGWRRSSSRSNRASTRATSVGDPAASSLTHRGLRTPIATGCKVGRRDGRAARRRAALCSVRRLRPGDPSPRARDRRTIDGYIAHVVARFRACLMHGAGDQRRAVPTTMAAARRRPTRPTRHRARRRPGAPAGSAAAVSGELTVWAMGNEGAMLGRHGRQVHGRQPGRDGQRDAGRLGPGRDQAADRDRRRRDARRQPDGHRHDGPVRRDRRPRAGPRRHRPGAVLRERLEHERRRRHGVRRAVVRRDARSSTTGPTSPRRPASPPRRRPGTSSRPMAKAIKDRAAPSTGIALGTKNSQEYLPFVWSNGGDVIGATTARSRSTARRPSRP